MANYIKPAKGTRYSGSRSGARGTKSTPATGRINHRSGETDRLIEDRREQAKVRIDLRAKRSPQEQLALLDRRLGKGVGAEKERKRLKAFIDLGKSEERRHEATKVRPSQKKGAPAAA